MKIAYKFGRIDYDTLGDELTFEKFQKWNEFFNLSISDHQPEHYYLANIARMLSMDKKAKVTDFLLGFKPKAKKLSAQDLANYMRAKYGKKEDK